MLASSLYIANLGVQNNTTIYKNAARKGTGVQVSYDLYVPKTGHNYGLTRNTKVVYNKKNGDVFHLHFFIFFYLDNIGNNSRMSV